MSRIQEVKDALFLWFKAVLGSNSNGSEVYIKWANDPEPLNHETYATLFVSSDFAYGKRNEYLDESGNGFIQETERKITLICSVFGLDYFDIADRVTEALEDIDALQNLEQSGISFINSSDVKDTTDFDTTMFENQAVVEIEFGYVSTKTVQTGTIQQIEFSGSLLQDGNQEDSTLDDITIDSVTVDGTLDDINLNINV